MIKPMRFGATAGLVTALLVAFAANPATPRVLGQSLEAGTANYNLLTNPGMESYEAAYDQFEGVNCQVASGWERFWYGGSLPCWMDTRVFANSHLGGGWVEKIEGETSQMLVSRQPYSAGLRQQITGLTPGLGYAFHAAMLTIFQTSAQDPVNGTMVKQVGLDPTGGTDPQALTVLWCDPDDHDQGPWSVDLQQAFWALSPAVTVFIRVVSPYESGDPSLLNLSFLDSAILAQTPQVSATSPAFSMSPTFSVHWDNAVAAPGGEVKRYDVQWLDEEEGIWHDWYIRTTKRYDSFAGQQGHTYHFRARALQRYENGARLYSPYRAEGDTSTQVQGTRLVGQVRSNEDRALGGATVALVGTEYAVTSGADGRFELDLQPFAEPQTVTVDHPAWLSPPPVYGVTFGPTETVAITWTVRPPDDALINGQFEAGLEGWSPIVAGGETPVVVTAPVHTGQGALALESDAPGGLTVGVSQTASLAGSWEPVVSFWYNAAAAGAEDALRVILTVDAQESEAVPTIATTQVFTPSLGYGGWRHEWYSVGPRETYLAGTVTVRLEVRHAGGSETKVYLDEVSLGATPGGPFKICLPLAVRQP
jgi:hypothetical protein